MAAIALVGYGISSYLKPKSYPPGVLIESEPVQSTLSGDVPKFAKAGFEITPLARFETDARVLHTKRYRSDAVAKLAPFDLALGWGPMSDQQVLDQLEISQTNRFFFWEYQKAPPIPKDEITRHATNTHLIPATDEVYNRIAAAREGDLIHLSGFLIEANKPQMPPWRSSLSRTDSGKGACEIVWVESLETR